MTSNPEIFALGTPALYEPLFHPGWSHSWNINKCMANNGCTDKKGMIGRIISDYYHKEKASGLFMREKNDANTATDTATVNVVDTTIASSSSSLYQSFPRHHALILSAFCSSMKLTTREFPLYIEYGYHNCPYQNAQRLSRFAYSRVHNPRYSTQQYTEIKSIHQKNHLATLSGMTGLLVLRLLMNPQISCTRTKKTNIQNTNQYIHSALAAEYLVGNRYYRTLTKNQSSKYPVGFNVCDAKSNLSSAEITPDALIQTKNELQDSYNANIDRLLVNVEMFKRGFIGADEIREDPEFVRLMTAFWRLSNQHMLAKEEFEKQPKPDNNIFNYPSPMPFSTVMDAKRVTMISLIAETALIAPQLYNYDIAHLFDNINNSYAYYIHTTKKTWLRLAAAGSTASFLAFAGIEPTLVTDEYAPILGGGPSVYHGVSLVGCANYIPSRDPVFGELRVKHRKHIMRTADAINSSYGKVHPNPDAPLRGVFRDNIRFRPVYSSYCDIVDYVRKRDYRVDLLQYFPENHENTGEVISEYEANQEFLERVYRHGGLTPNIYSCYDNDDDDEYDDEGYDDDYDDN